MAFLTITNSFTNGTTADATQVNTNFQDVVDGTSDGTTDFNIAGLTAAGNLVINGNTTLGNATSDDVTITGSLASTINIKTTNSFNIGSSTLGLAGIYFGANSQTVRIIGSASMSATYTITLPVSAGVNGFGLQTNGSGVTSWQPMQVDTLATSSADYTVLDTDGYRTHLFTTGNSDRTLTLPTAADNTDRLLIVKKVDSGTGKVIVDGEGSETIDGATTLTLYNRYDGVVLVCDGSAWHVADKYAPCSSQSRADTGGGTSYGTTDTKIRKFANVTTVGTGITVGNTAGNGTTFTIVEPGVYSMSFTDIRNSAGCYIGISINSASLTTNVQGLTATERLIMTRTVASENGNCSVTARLAAGDVIRPHGDGTADNTSNMVQFVITQVARL